jgi:polar amino acid transport system substrate-binding protein
MKRLLGLIFFAFLLALLAACQPVAPDSHYGAMRRAGKMVVGTSADYPPFESLDADGDMTGFDIALIREIGERLNLQVVMEDRPFDTLIDAVAAGEVDLAISAFNYSAERDTVIDFTDSYYNARDAILVVESFPVAFNGPTELVAYQVGVQHGTTQDSWIAENLVGSGAMSAENVAGYERVDEAVAALQGGEVDAVLMESVVALSLIDELGGLRIGYEGSVSSGPINIVVPEGDTELTQALNETIAELAEEGFIDQLIIDYMQ